MRRRIYRRLPEAAVAGGVVFACWLDIEGWAYATPFKVPAR